MSRIVLATLGSLGDLHPYLAVGLGLSDRGHDVAIATAEDYRANVESAGLEFCPLRPNLPSENMAALLMDPRHGTKRVLKDYIFGNIRNTYADLTAAVAGADLLVAHEIIYVAQCVAQVQKLPWVTGILAPASFFSAYDPMVVAPYPFLAKLRWLGYGFNRAIVELGRITTNSWGQPFHQLRHELNLPPLKNPIVDDKYSPDLVLAMFSSVVGTAQPDWPPQTVVTGFTFYDGNPRSERLRQRQQPLSPELQAFLEAGAPPLVFTLGSAAVMAAGDFYNQSVKAAIALDRRAVLLLGDNPVPDNLPASIFTCKYAPYGAIFPQASAIVHQGGIGTTAQGLRSGRPTLVMPYSHDQPDNADRLQRLGVSRTIARNRYRADRVVRELSQLLTEPHYRERAEEIGRIVRSENAVEIACREIERNLPSKVAS